MDLASIDYTTRYGLEFNPFLKNSRDISVKTKGRGEAVTRLNYPAKLKGSGVLTGAPGRGKTTAVRAWAASLNPSLYRVVYSCLSSLTANGFYCNLAAEPSFRKPVTFPLPICCLANML